jgi:4,5-epoxidase
MKKNEVSVLIVGAGPTGLALACDLLSRGVAVKVVDNLEKPPTTIRALGLQPRGRQILDRLGALGDLPNENQLETKFDVYLDGRLALHMDLETLRGRYDSGVLRVPQTEIEQRLRTRLQKLGCEIAWGHEVIDIREEGEDILVSVRTKTGLWSLSARWVVGCDGAHSIVRKRVGAEFRGESFPETFLLGDVRMHPDREDGAAIYLHRNEMLAVAALPGRLWRVGVALPSGDPLKQSDSFKGDPDKGTASSEQIMDRLQQLFADYTGDHGTRLFDSSWLSSFHIHRRVSSSFRRGRLFIAGDAAHLTSPLGGQGMNSGIGDAFNLGWKLALIDQGLADEGLLDTYEGERRPVVGKIERATTQWTSILLGEGRVNRILRRYVLLPAMRLRALQAWVLTQRPALQESYRGGPLAPPLGWMKRLICRGPQAGDLGPDSRCKLLPEYEETTLSKVIGANWALILFGLREEPMRSCADAARTRLGSNIRILHVVTGESGLKSGADYIVQDHFGEIARAYRADTDTAILLRPDGHLAWRSQRPDVAGVTFWLDHILGIKFGSQSFIRVGKATAHD